MSSTFSTSLRLELIGNGDQSGTWGGTTNANLGTLLEQAIVGVVAIAMSDSTYTLTNFNGVSDEARNAVLVVSGPLTAQRSIIAPLVKKVYVIRNNTSGGQAIEIKTSTGTGIVIPNGATQVVYCDATNFYAATVSYSGATGTGNVVLAVSPTIASPALTGTPTAPTAGSGTNTTQVATTQFVTTAVVAATGALGTMSTQNANAVAITGGTLTGTLVNNNIVGSNSTGTRYISSSAPSGGSDGDIWYQVA